MRNNAVFLDNATLGPGLNTTAINRLVRLTSHRLTSPQQVKSRIKSQDIIITNKVILNQDNLQHAKHLKHIFLVATGTNNIDLNYCSQHSIKVWPVPSYSNDAVANHTLALLLALRQNLLTYHNKLQQKEWHSSKTFCLFNPPITELEQQTIGIIGYGNIGKRVATYAKTLNMKILIAKRNNKDTRVNRKTINYIFKNCDIISLHCPLTPETYQLANKTRIQSMKDNATIINTARGQLIDEQALATAIKDKKINAGLDVLSQEPPTNDNPLTQINQPNLLITPHIAWIATTTRQRLVDLLAQNIKKALT